VNRPLLIVGASLWLVAAARAHTPPTWPMRELIVRSETVVLATPADPTAPARFKAIRVLLGTALREGEVFEIYDLLSYDLRDRTEEGYSTRKHVVPAEALLFLGEKKDAAPVPSFPVTWSGLRFAAAVGAVYYAKAIPDLVPDALHQQAGCRLARYRPAVRWDDLVRKAETDAVEVNHIRALKEIDDPRRRNQALLDWVERHRQGFGGGLYMHDDEEPTFGWGSLEQDIFKWIFESEIPRDCWAAIKQYAELNQGHIPWLRSPAFGTRAGRRLLLSVVLDENALLGDRARALTLLKSAWTLWPATAGEDRAVEPLGEREQTALIDQVTPLLKNAYPRIRAAAAQALLEASSPKEEKFRASGTQRALPALTEAYRKEPPGSVRDALAEAVAGVAGPKGWEELSGNAHGVVVFLDPRSGKDAEGYCWIVAPQANAEIQEKPTLVLERLDEKQNIVEKKEQPLDHMKMGGWPTDPGADYCRLFDFSMADYTPGVWRMTVKGVAGDDKAPWTSEPRLLRLAPAAKPEQPNQDPSAPRIVIDP
jgi:hypothetical protein